ncbi:hypothetical protein [Kibdelosporangium aridum]|uniref:hypothetical protein n=1 Tax=Kibdelosporangium aridum TaxID=2030 RepID=UPI001F2123F6|nr:hypothetical protein [Kibdelosporangium aridum]
MPVAVSARYPSECPMCQGAGVLRWQQPCPDGVLRELEHPCPNGCGDGWRHPNAENNQVIEVVADHGGELEQAEDDRPSRRIGRVDQANTLGGEFVATALEAWGFTGKE